VTGECGGVAHECYQAVDLIIRYRKGTILVSHQPNDARCLQNLHLFIIVQYGANEKITGENRHLDLFTSVPAPTPALHLGKEAFKGFGSQPCIHLSFVTDLGIHSIPSW
jgi:hypothetical protein